MYYTIYKTTNIINDKYYIGMHKTNNLDDGYIGSGKLLKRAILKYGKDSFIKEILFIYDNPEEMHSKESELITENEIKNPKCYNLKLGGEGGWDLINKNSSTEQQKEKSKKAIKRLKFLIEHDKEWYKNYIKKQSDKQIKWLKENKRYNIPSWKGKKHSESSKNKIGDANRGRLIGNKNPSFGTVWITNGSENKKILKDALIPNGWYKGRKIKKDC